jgi:hypothetical protein
MQIFSLHADARADGRQRARSDLLERRLALFPARLRPRVIALARRHPRLQDLALSFPGLLFALAVPRPAFDPEPVIDLVVAGVRLRDAASQARVPMWLRRFRPEAFSAALPILPDDEFFSRQVANHLPPKKCAAWWLENVGNACKWADDSVAVWIAREVNHGRLPPVRQGLRLICLWAWYSKSGFARHSDIVWTPSMKLANARGAAEVWVERLRFQFDHGGPRVREMWAQSGCFGGFAFVPLDTCEAVQAEAIAMRNCVAGYLSNIARNECRVWSVQRDGARVATLEVRLAWDGSVPYIPQIKAKDNARAPLEVWMAARAWLAAQDIEHLAPKSPARVRHPFDRQRWIEVWRPYWLSKRRFPKWLPLWPSRGAMNRLCLDARVR